MKADCLQEISLGDPVATTPVQQQFRSNQGSDLVSSMLEHVHFSDDTKSVLENLLERIQIEFGSDGCFISIGTQSQSDQGPQVPQIHGSVGIPNEFVETLALGSSWGDGQGPIPAGQAPNATQFSWYWEEAIHDPLEDVDIGRLTLLFNQKRTPSSDERAALDSIKPVLRLFSQMLAHSSKLEAANHLFHSLTSTIPGVVYQRVVETNGSIRYTYISESAGEFFGVPASVVLSDPNALFNSYKPEYRDTFRQRLIEASKTLTTWDVEAAIVTPNGREKHTHAIAKPELRDDGSVVWTGVVLDASRIKNAELRAAETEANTRRTIVESLPQGFLLFNSDDKLILKNQTYDMLYPELAAASEEGADYFKLIRAELQVGSNFDGNSNTFDEQLNERSSNHVMEQDVQFERRISEGRSILVNERRTPLGDTVILYADISKIKKQEQELERHAARLEEANAELQQFAYVASHDLQEPLRKIEAFGARLNSGYADQLDSRGLLFLDRMVNAASRMRILINDLLDYSRVGAQEKSFQRVQLEALVREVEVDLETTISSQSGTVEIGELPTIIANRTQMRQLFQNIISNAIKYHHPERAPEIKIQSKALDDDNYEISISDNGIGFDPQYEHKIFEIFQRLHGRNEYEGTGVGLATCRKIVERHNGKIFARSEMGEGCTIYITLPSNQDQHSLQVGDYND